MGRGAEDATGFGRGLGEDLGLAEVVVVVVTVEGGYRMDGICATEYCALEYGGRGDGGDGSGCKIDENMCRKAVEK